MHELSTLARRDLARKNGNSDKAIPQTRGNVKSCFTHLNSTFIRISREVYPRRIESRVIAPPRRRSNVYFCNESPELAFTLDEHQTIEFTAESATSRRHALSSLSVGWRGSLAILSDYFPRCIGPYISLMLVNRHRS